jgi:simple sugar transport system permease protein
MLTWPENRSLVNIINEASVLYLSGLAAAIGFRMNLFNIGVEGQYRVATFVAALFAAQAFLPGYLNTVATILVAMATGALWAGIAAVLRVTRGVSEVIGTIMLNAIAVSLTAYLLRQVGSRQGQTIVTDTIPESGWIPGIPVADSVTPIYGLAALAIVAGVAFSVLLNRTRFGFDLKASGLSPSAASASGINARGMVIKTMLLSGAVAGLIGLPDLLGTTHSYTTDFTAGLGFLGIAVALLGRNRPVGIAFAALLFGFLDRALVPLQIADYPASVVTIIQGTIVLAVVIANQIARRIALRSAERATAQASPPSVAEAGQTPSGRSGTDEWTGTLA